MIDNVMQVLAWSAVAFLAMGYWAQVWKIHQHREVRDLSIVSYSLLAVGFAILTYTAWEQKSVVFIIKQILTFIPCGIIVFQIIRHKEDEWHDARDTVCSWCGNELEPHWRHCPDCGASVHEPTLPIDTKTGV